MRVCSGPACVEKISNDAGPLCRACLRKIPRFLRREITDEMEKREGVATQETIRLCISALFHRSKTGINPSFKQVERARKALIEERDEIIRKAYR